MVDPNNPWGQRPNKPNNDFDEFVKGIKALFGDKKTDNPFGKGPSNQKPGKGLFLLIVIAVFGVIAFKAAYTVNPGEQGVVLRFGQFYETTQPGLHFLIPFIEEVIKVDVEGIREENFGVRGEGGRGRGNELESLMLTSDLNVIQLSWQVQYKIQDPEFYLFNIADPIAAVRDASESVLRRLVGNRDFDMVMKKREQLGTIARDEMQNLLDKYNSGLQVVVFQLQEVVPPEEVRPSFNEVNQAEQDKNRLKQEAEKMRNERVPRAKGEATQMLEEARGYAIERVNQAEGDVVRFNAILSEYNKAKTVTRTRLYVEALREALPQVTEVIIVDQSKKGMMPLVNIGAATTTLRQPQTQASRPFEQADEVQETQGAPRPATTQQSLTEQPFNPRRR